MKISIGPSATAAEKNAATALQNYLARMKIFDAASLSFAVGPEAARAARGRKNHSHRRSGLEAGRSVRRVLFSGARVRLPLVDGGC